MSETSQAVEQATADLKAAEGRITAKITDLTAALTAAQVEDPAVVQAVSDLQAEVTNVGNIVPAS